MDRRYPAPNKLGLYLPLALFCALGNTAQAGPEYAGSTVCKTCHPAVWVSFYKNPHARTMQAASAPPEKTGCEGCHGPGGDHVAQHGGKATIKAFSDLTPSRVIEACLTCHAESLGRANIRRSSHTLAQVACTSCHSIHRSQTPRFLLAREQRDVCYGCHADVRAQFSLPFKHRVNEGFMNCTDCHNPHGAATPTWTMGARPRMVAPGLGNEEPCLKCHTDKRGPFAFEHDAVRIEGCNSCHQPHGSANSRLLRRPAVFTICLECHNGQGNFGPQSSGLPLTPGFHNMADPHYRNCTTCHVRIHGSNSDATFLR